MISGKRERGARVGKLGLGLAAVFAILAAYYSATTPIFEAPDELWHYLVVSDLAHGHFADPRGEARQEATQPPLYYALAAGFWWLAPVSVDATPPLNPHFDSRPTAKGNINFLFHGDPTEYFPYGGLARSVHLVRLLSVLLGAVTVLGAFVLGRIVAPERLAVAILAAAFVGLDPELLFLAGTINNDLAIIATATWTMVFLAQWLEQQSEYRSPHPLGPGGRSELLSSPLVPLTLMLGLALLSKATAIPLAFVVGVALIRYAPSGETWRRSIRPTLVLAGALVIGGWWYARLALRYHDPLGTGVRSVALGRTVPYGAEEAVWDFRELVLTSIARFGAVNLAPPLSAVLPYVALGLGGLAVGLWTLRAQRRPLLVVQAAWIGLIVVLFFVWQLPIPGPQGRLIFPAVASLGVVWALGMDSLLVRLAGLSRRAIGTGLAGSALVGAVLFPAVVIVPAYPPSPSWLLPSRPASVKPLTVAFGRDVVLVGADLPPRDWSGDDFTARLYWRRGSQPTHNLSYFVHLVDETGQVRASIDDSLAPGIPLSIWPRDRVVEVPVPLRLPAAARTTAAAPALLRVEVGVYALSNGQIQPIAARSDGATSIELATLHPAIVGWPGGIPPVARFGPRSPGEIDLVGWTVPDADVATSHLRGQILWTAPARPTVDYTVFVQLLRDGKLVAGWDAQPVNGQYPTTSWRPGEVVRDAFDLALPADLAPGPATLIVGLYDHTTMARLRLGDSDAFTLTTIDP